MVKALRLRNAVGLITNGKMGLALPRQLAARDCGKAETRPRTPPMP
jgi:hypothetical protein